jgi:hypothetical protein
MFFVIFGISYNQRVTKPVIGSLRSNPGSKQAILIPYSSDIPFKGGERNDVHGGFLEVPRL